jgi:hypothetical protein
MNPTRLLGLGLLSLVGLQADALAQGLGPSWDALTLRAESPSIFNSDLDTEFDAFTLEYSTRSGDTGLLQVELGRAKGAGATLLELRPGWLLSSVPTTDIFLSGALGTALVDDDLGEGLDENFFWGADLGLRSRPNASFDLGASLEYRRLQEFDVDGTALKLQAFYYASESFAITFEERLALDDEFFDDLEPFQTRVGLRFEF